MPTLKIIGTRMTVNPGAGTVAFLDSVLWNTPVSPPKAPVVNCINVVGGVIYLWQRGSRAVFRRNNTTPYTYTLLSGSFNVYEIQDAITIWNLNPNDPTQTDHANIPGTFGAYHRGEITGTGLPAGMDKTDFDFQAGSLPGAPLYYYFVYDNGGDLVLPIGNTFTCDDYFWRHVSP